MTNLTADELMTIVDAEIEITERSFDELKRQHWKAFNEDWMDVEAHRQRVNEMGIRLDALATLKQQIRLAEWRKNNPDGEQEITCEEYEAKQEYEAEKAMEKAFGGPYEIHD